MASPPPLKAIRWSLRNVVSGHLGERGVSAVEFALIIPFLLLLTVGIIEMSNVYFMRSQLSEIARDGVRRLAIGAQEEEVVKKLALKRLAEATGASGKVDVDEAKFDDIIDVTMTVAVPFADVLLFDELIETLWANAPATLSADATMMKQ